MANESSMMMANTRTTREIDRENKHACTWKNGCMFIQDLFAKNEDTEPLTELRKQYISILTHMLHKKDLLKRPVPTFWKLKAGW